MRSRSKGLHWHSTTFWDAPQNPEGARKKKIKCQEGQLEHTPGPGSYTGGQLTAYNPLSVRGWTKHAQTDNLQLFFWHGSQNLCQTMRKLVSRTQGQWNPVHVEDS